MNLGTRSQRTIYLVPIVIMNGVSDSTANLVHSVYLLKIVLRIVNYFVNYEIKNGT